MFLIAYFAHIQFCPISIGSRNIFEGFLQSTTRIQIYFIALIQGIPNLVPEHQNLLFYSSISLPFICKNMR